MIIDINSRKKVAKRLLKALPLNKLKKASMILVTDGKIKSLFWVVEMTTQSMTRIKIILAE